MEPTEECAPPSERPPSPPNCGDYRQGYHCASEVTHVPCFFISLSPFVLIAQLLLFTCEKTTLKWMSLPYNPQFHCSLAFFSFYILLSLSLPVVPPFLPPSPAHYMASPTRDAGKGSVAVLKVPVHTCSFFLALQSNGQVRPALM